MRTFRHLRHLHTVDMVLVYSPEDEIRRKGAKGIFHEMKFIPVELYAGKEMKKTIE